MLTVEETFNKQNYKNLCTVIQGSLQTGSKDRKRSLSCLVESVYDGITSLHFCEKGIKTDVRNYRDILTNVVEPLKQTIFQNRSWIFQQVSAPAHKAKTTQQWLENHVTKLTSIEHWLSASPDLYSLNNKLWSVLESMVCTIRYHNLESLKQAQVETGQFSNGCLLYSD